MKGLCKTKCGLDIDYEPIEFSDGFTYYLPKNLDGTHHYCIMFRDDAEEWADSEEEVLESLKKYYNNHKKDTKLSFDEFSSIKLDMNEDPQIYLESVVGLDFMLIQTLISGKMLVLKKEIEQQMISAPAPFYITRNDYQTGGRASNPTIDVNLTNVTNDEIADWVYLETPTNKGYQLEYLGKYYELMLKLEDAKKCFILQHDITGEPELKEYADKLDSDIEEKNIMYSKSNKLEKEKLTKEEIDKLIKNTEENIQKYIIQIFENDFKEIWERFPNFKKSIENRREIQENSLIPEQEKTPIQHLTMGQLCTIMLKSNNRKKAREDGKCNICNTKYKKGDQIFLESIETKTMTKTSSCKNEQCFVNQGGMHKNIPRELISICILIKDVRNPLTHSTEKDFTDIEFWNVNFSRIKSECELINLYINRYLNNKEFT